ncbi:AlpA family transcriptional regulator [Dyadobacter sp. CY323]|uniref:helix-turn-helix transcriptional regulator n=1 Tax=Dyadobacter sp. CY323 TaxID=2907302 RepID=UPI001F21A6EF|nr:helix-turn-helix domain-containing protein [Dyadobacter sp. CY323]MCE6992071.1 helix-turn-helix domain-containing protein [Dyadobacter sp. CY323]
MTKHLTIVDPETMDELFAAIKDLRLICDGLSKIAPSLHGNSESVGRHQVKKMITLDELVEYTGYSKKYIYNLTAKALIPHYKPIGNKLFFNIEEIEAWLSKNRVKTLDEIDREVEDYVMKNPFGSKRKR